MNLLQQFQQFIKDEHLFAPKDRLLLAVSGGVDSVVLCALCTQAGYDFVLAHCNFQLRGTESERDERFVRDLGGRYQKPVLVKHFDTAEYALSNKISIQVAARDLRYAWFRELVRETDPAEDIGKAPDTDQPSPKSILLDDAIIQHAPPISHIVVAHHQDDNIETMLMNFFKGTGIAGLRGILPKQGNILRPLLFARKEMLKEFAVENNLDWVEDSSNQSDKYSRNYFRNQLIPLLNNIYPEAEKNLTGNLQRFKEIEILYRQSIAQHLKKLLEYKGNEIHIPVLKLQKTVPLVSVVYEIIKAYGFSADQATETVALLKSETGRYLQSATHRIIKNRNWLIIAPLNHSISAHILVERKDQLIQFEGGSLTMASGTREMFNASLPTAPETAFLDASSIQFPLLLRKWKTGDYFYPLGMRKKKKLGRFFIDQKLSKTDKEQVWVLEADKKIVWVVGLRIDDRHKVSNSTRDVLRIDLKKSVQV